MLDRRIVRWAGALVAALGATSALGFENTIRVVVDPARHWQCGDGFFPNGGSETYRHLRVSADGAALGEFDLALPSECTKVLEYFTDVPADTTIDIRVGTNLVSWPDTYSVPETALANNPGVTVVKDTPVGFDTVTLTLPRAPDAKIFASLKVVIP